MLLCLVEKPILTVLTGTLNHVASFKEFQQEHIYFYVKPVDQNYVIPKHCSRTLVFSWYGHLFSVLSGESIYYLLLIIH